MPDDTDMAERHSRFLGEVAELSMTLARRLHERAMGAETEEEAERAALAFHRVSRSLRQTLALEARLERERRREGRDVAREAAETRRERVAGRKARVDAEVSRLIWTEGERGEIGELLVDFKHVLDREAADEAFLDGPVEALVARIREDLGFAAGQAGCSSPPTPPPERQSSA